MIDDALEYPPEPAEVDGDVAHDADVLRYDDVIQDGRLRIDSTWRPTGRLLWGKPEVARIFDSMGDGITHVLARTVLEASEARLAPRSPLRTQVKYCFEHTVDAAGAVDKLLFSTWLVAHARGRDGVERLAGRAYGQRVFTRHGAAAGEHLVRSLAGFGPTGIPVRRGIWEPASSLLELPRGAEPLDEGPALAPAPVVFGLSHTDLNQHVNFLMYHRLFEDAALARFVARGLGARFVSRHAAFGYRKPSFAGDVLRIALRAFRLGPLVGVNAALVEDGVGPDARPTFRDFGPYRCAARVVFRA